eukprot:385624_1
MTAVVRSNLSTQNKNTRKPLLTNFKQDKLLNKDYLSTWIQNKQFISQINDDTLNKLQNDIINNVFGGFSKLLKALLKHYEDKCMTYSQQLTLNNILSIVDPNNTQTTYNNKCSLLMLPDDCIINAMKYLDYNSKLALQYTCRTLSIITRKPTVWNNQTDLTLIGANTHNIASMILSDNVNDNIDAIEWIYNNLSITYTNPSKFVKKYYATCPVLQKILSSHLHISSKLATIVNLNISNEKVEKCLFFFVCLNEFIYKIFPAITYVISSPKTTAKRKKQIFGYISLRGRLKDEFFVFHIMKEKNALFLQTILDYDEKKTKEIINNILSFGFIAHIKAILRNKWMVLNIFYMSDILNHIAKDSPEIKEEIIDYIINNSLLMNPLIDKVKNEKIYIGAKVQMKDRGKWYNSEIIEIKENNKEIKMHYDTYSARWDEWLNLTKQIDCQRLKLTHLHIIRLIFKHATHNQRIKIIKKGYLQDMDIYSRLIIGAELNDEQIRNIFENYIKQWEIMNKYLSTVADENTIDIFKQHIHESEYDFEPMLNDINGYDRNESVIIKFMRKRLNWNKIITNSFYMNLKLILIVEVLDFDDKYIEKCILDIIGKYCKQNISKVPFIASTKYFNIINKLENRMKMTLLCKHAVCSSGKQKQTITNKINNDKSISKYKLNAILFDKTEINWKYRDYDENLNQKQLTKSKKAQFKFKYSNQMQYKYLNSSKNGKIRYKYHRKRS